MSGRNAIVQLGAKIDAQNLEIRALKATIDSKIDAQTAEIAKKIDAQTAEIRAQTAELAAQTAKIDAQTDQLRALRWMVVTILIMVLVMAAALVTLAIQSFSKPVPPPPLVQAVEAPPRPVAVDADLPAPIAPDSQQARLADCRPRRAPTPLGSRIPAAA